MKIFRLVLFFSVFLFLKESVIAQPGEVLKNSGKADSVENADSTKRAKNRKFWAELWEDYAPAVSVSGGMHTVLMSETKVRTFEKGPAWNVVFNFPFDREHYFNWEFAYQMLYGRDTSQTLVSTDIFTFFGMRFYCTDRYSLLRPFISWGIAEYYLVIPLKINIAAGLDYRITDQWSAQLSLGDVYTFRDKTFGNGTFPVPYTSYAGFLGIRYQL
jgi:hypothetical protein